MNKLFILLPFIGHEKTVLITGADFDITDTVEFHENVFVHYTKEGRLHRYNPHQQEMLRYYIEDKGCTQILFVGSIDDALIKKITGDNSIHSPSQALKFNLGALLNDKQEFIVSDSIRTQLYIELNVIRQCKLLMDYYFVSPRVDKKLLDIKGVVVDMLGNKLKPICHNGIFYNDIISSN
jgi:hypothetical protein